MPNIIAFIPLRCGSKAIPFKNIKNFCGKPLAYWNINALEETDDISEIVIATDCKEIISEINKFRFSKVSIYERDAENAQDTSSTEAVMLEYLNKKSIDKDAVFMLVQATSPFTTSSHFSEAISAFSGSDCDSLLSCAKVKRFFWEENGVPVNYDYMNRPRRQDFNGALMENGAFYINTVKNIIKHKNRLSGNIKVYEMPEYTSLEIDEEDDWVMGEALMRKHVLSHQKQKPIKLFATDVDGVLTDAGMYYSENGDELKKFNTTDGKGIELLRNQGIKTVIITSENTKIVERRAKKLKVDHLFQGTNKKLDLITELCEKEGISLEEVAYIGDDINDYDLLSHVGLPACPANAVDKNKNIPNIIHLKKKGGEGVVREFVEIILHNHIH